MPQSVLSCTDPTKLVICVRNVGGVYCLVIRLFSRDGLLFGLLPREESFL